MIPDSSQRQQKYKKLKSDYEELEKEIGQLREIDDKFDMDLSQITNEVLDYYAIKMNDWDRKSVV